MSSRNYSIVEYYAEHGGYRCGYCKATDTNYSHGKREIENIRVGTMRVINAIWLVKTKTLANFITLYIMSQEA
jgi:hypothetical protein